MPMIRDVNIKRLDDLHKLSLTPISCCVIDSVLIPDNNRRPPSQFTNFHCKSSFHTSLQSPRQKQYIYRRLTGLIQSFASRSMLFPVIYVTVTVKLTALLDVVWLFSSVL